MALCARLASSPLRCACLDLIDQVVAKWATAFDDDIQHMLRRSLHRATKIDGCFGVLQLVGDDVAGAIDADCGAGVASDERDELHSDSANSFGDLAADYVGHVDVRDVARAAAVATIDAVDADLVHDFDGAEDGVHDDGMAML